MPLIEMPGATGSEEIKNIVDCFRLSLPFVYVVKVPIFSRDKSSALTRKTLELTSHHLHPVSAAAMTAPQANSSHFFTTDCRVLRAESNPTNSLLLGTLAKTPSLPVNPLGGHLGEGEGIGLAVFLATAFTSSDEALGVIKVNIIMATIADKADA